MHHLLPHHPVCKRLIPLSLLRTAVLVMVCLFSYTNANAQAGKTMNDTTLSSMTVIKVFTGRHDAYAEVIFGESARFYRLLKSSQDYAAQLRILQEAVKKQHRVWIKTSVPNGDTILIVKKQS